MKIINSLSRWVGYAATFCLGLMMLLTVADVFLRFFFNSPISGTTELTQLFMVAVVFPALAWCGVTGGHIKVDLIVGRFRPRIQAIIDIITLLLSLFIFTIITWRSFLESMQMTKTSSLLGIPIAPFYYTLTFSFGLLCLVIITLIIANFKKVVK